MWTHIPRSVCGIGARSLFAGAGAHGARFAAELLTELAAKQRTVEAELSMEETISAIRRAAKQGDDSKIPMIAAILQPGASSSGDALSQEIEVRLAAVHALRALVPAFPSAWPGWQAVRGLLQSVALEDTEEELRLAAIQALKEATDLKFCEHCLLLKHSDPFKMRSAMMPAAHVGQPTRCQG
eukprot:symbB.v1.2.015745.t1/scaffold1123.1/size136624/10